MVVIATTPLWAAVVAFLLFKKKPSKFWVIATALAIVVFMINYSGGFQSQSADWRLLLPIAAGLCYGVEIIAVGKVVEKLNPETTMLLEMGLVAVLLLPVTFFFRLPDFANRRNSGFSRFRCGDCRNCLPVFYLRY